MDTTRRDLGLVHTDPTAPTGELDALLAAVDAVAHGRRSPDGPHVRGIPESPARRQGEAGLDLDHDRIDLDPRLLDDLGHPAVSCDCGLGVDPGAAHVARRARSHRPLAVFLLGIDHFDALCDAFGGELGRTVGEGAAAAAAARLGACVRADDRVYRLTADELAVLCPGIADLDTTRAVARRLRDATGGMIRVGDRILSISVGVGAALLDRGARIVDPAELVGRAATALDQARGSGRGGLCVDPLAATGAVVAAPVTRAPG